jgi:hypothetical protein
MVRFLLRLASLLLLAAAFAAVVIDGARSIAAGAVSLTSFGEAATLVFPSKFPVLQAALQSRLPPWAWNPAAVDLLRLPAWLVLAVLGLILLRLARRPRTPIGYSSRS